MPYIIEKVGDWDKMNAYFSKLSDGHLQKAFEDKIKQDGELLVDAIKGHISSQDLGWTPLAESTQRKKGGSMIYVESGSLLGSIQAKEASGGGDMSIQVGAFGGHPSGESASQILEWLEYGTNKIPPRPLIRPTFDEKQNEIKQGWRELILELMKV